MSWSSLLCIIVHYSSNKNIISSSHLSRIVALGFKMNTHLWDISGMQGLWCVVWCLYPIWLNKLLFYPSDVTIGQEGNSYRSQVVVINNADSSCYQKYLTIWLASQPVRPVSGVSKVRALLTLYTTLMYQEDVQNLPPSSPTCVNWSLRCFEQFFLRTHGNIC